MPENTLSRTPAAEESSAILLENECTTALTSETGLQAEFAAQIAGAMVRGLRKQLGTQQIYIPAWPKNQDRDQRVREQFNGTNAAEICARYDISRSRLYQIVGRAARPLSP